MPQISFRCSGCQAQLKADESRAGNQINCPRCKTPLVVPGRTPPAPPLPPQADATPIASRPQKHKRPWLIPALAATAGLVVAYFAGREHVKYELRAAFKEAISSTDESLFGVAPERDSSASPPAAKEPVSHEALEDLVPANPVPVEPGTLDIDSYSFTWDVASLGEARLTVEKTEETTRIRLSKSYNSLNLSGEEAEAIAKLLEQTTQRFEAQRQRGGKTEDDLETSTHQVTFLTDPEIGFRVSIREKRAFGGGSVWLERKTATEFARWLQHGRSLIAHVDQSIQP